MFPGGKEGGTPITPTLLAGLDPACGSGLEFASGAAPLLSGPDWQVLHVDRAGAEVDWRDGSLREAIRQALPGQERWFAFAVARDAVASVPDIVWWLAEIRSVLSSGAALRLGVPDRRFTADIGRRETNLADVLSAYLQQVRAPRPRDILDYHLARQHVDVEAAWNGAQALRHGFPLEQATAGIESAQAAIAGLRQDVRCGVFTPRSFLSLMVGLARLGLLWFAHEWIFPAREYQTNFVVHLLAADDRHVIEESWRGALATWIDTEASDEAISTRQELGATSRPPQTPRRLWHLA